MFLPPDLAGTFVKLQSPRFGGNYFNHVKGAKLALPTETYFRKMYSSDSYIFLTARRHYHVTEYKEQVAHPLNKKKRDGSRVAHNFCNIRWIVIFF